MRHLALPVLMIAVLLAGCSSEPRIDGSSPSAAEESIQDVRESLDDAERLAFDEAYERIVAYEIERNLDELMREGGREAIIMRVLQRLDGKTASDVIRLGAEMGGRPGQQQGPGDGSVEVSH